MVVASLKPGPMWGPSGRQKDGKASGRVNEEDEEEERRFKGQQKAPRVVGKTPGTTARARLGCGEKRGTARERHGQEMRLDRMDG